MKYSIDIINQISEGSYQYEIDGINAICTNLGGVGGHTYTIDALNELCTLQGVASGHAYNIDALNAICSGAYTDEYSAWVDVGTKVNQNEAESEALFLRQTDINNASKTAYNEFIKVGKTDGWWDKADIIRVLANNVDADARLNIKSNAFNATKNGTPTFVPKLGFIGTAGNYLKSGYTFRTSNVNLTPTDACILVWNNKKATDKAGMIVGASTQDASITDKISIEPNQNNNKLRVVFASSESVPVTDWYESYKYAGGLHGFDNNGVTHKIIRNGLTKKSAAYTAGYFPTHEMYELAGRLRGTVYNWLGDYSFLYCGGSLTDSQHSSLYNATKKLLTKLASAWNKPNVSVPLYIIAGQSNCGRSQAANIAGDKLQYKGALTGVNIYNPAYYQNSVWNQANVGVNTMLLDQVNADEFGCEASLGFELQNYKGEDIYIFKHGFGGTSLFNDWNPVSTVSGAIPYVNNELYKCFVANLREAIKTIVIGGKVPEIKSFIWMQGEQDSTVTAQADAYGANLSAFFTAIKAEIVSIYADLGMTVPVFKTVIGKISTARWGATVPTAQQAFCDNAANNALIVDTSAYTLLGDNTHFDAASQIQFGIDIFNQIKDL